MSHDVYRFAHEGNETSMSAAQDSMISLLDSEEENTAETDVPQADPENDDEGEVEETEDTELEGEETEVDEEEEDDEETEEEDDEETDDAEPQTYKIKVDGEEVEVTLEELQKGYSRTSDYTRKTQQLAEQRKAAEAELAQTREAKQQYAQMLGELETALTSMTPAEPDWDKLRRESPDQFPVAWADWQRQQQALSQVQAERQRAQEEVLTEQRSQLQAQIEAERQRLIEAIPEWQDAEKAKTEKGKLFDFAKGLGYTEEQLGQVYDHRLMVILRDAMRYRELSTKGPKKVKRTAPKVLQPGTRDPNPGKKSKRTQQQRHMARLQKTGRAEDAAAVIFGLLDD